jgi:Fic family protein
MDSGEPIGLMEPMLLAADAPMRPALTELAFELAQKSTRFKSSLPDSMVGSLSDLVRSMNCYYSNLIEGHDTHPIDIERALKQDYSGDPKKRDLQLEAKAHIAVQKWIDTGGLPNAATRTDSIREIHRRFYDEMPADLCFVENPDTKERVPVVPGELRNRDVKVGLHIAVSPGAVPRFLGRFDEAYSRLNNVETVLAAAAAHHRLVWIHPFMDGNGRVVRLMSHAMLLAPLDTGSLWSIARGLARNVEVYKGLLAACDLKRRNDLDGRGTLSEEALSRFTEFFLRICIDQVDFMRGLVQPDELRARLLVWADEEIRRDRLPPKSGILLESLLYRGELPRSEVAELLGVGDRQARRVTASLTEREIVVSESSRAPIRLAFPATLAERWMPGLFPPKAKEQ